jgi:membrane protease YdiL (CAAX protease family)
VLSEKPWRWETVVLLLLGLMLLALAGGGALAGLAQQYGPSSDRDQRFLRFVISTVTFQCVGLVIIHTFIRRHGLNWREFLGLNGRPLRRITLWALAMSAFAIPVTLLLHGFSLWLVSHFMADPGPQPVMVVVQESSGLWERVAMGVAAIAIAPVFEESLFRGILYPTIKNAGYPALAMAGTSLLFGAIHAALVPFLPLTFLALMLTVLFEKTDALLAPIVTHALFNAVNFTYMILSSGKTTLTG